MRHQIERAINWLPPLLWMALIFFFSTSTFSDENTASIIIPVLRTIFPRASPEMLSEIHFFIRKTSHFIEFATLSLLWMKTLRWQWREKSYPFFFLSFFISSLYAVLDEFHQSFVSERTESYMDMLIDSAGALSSLIILKVFKKSENRK